MPDLRLSFIVQAIDAAVAPMRRIAEGVIGGAQRIAKAFAPANAMLAQFGRSYEGLALAVGGGIEIKEIIGDEDMFNRLRVQYGMTAGAAEDLHQRVLAAAQATTAPLDQVKAAVAGYAQAGGDVATFADNVDLAARAVSLLGGQGTEVGQVLAALEHHFDIKGPEELTRTLAALYEQSIKTPGGFQDMVSGLDRTAELYASIGHLGPDAAREIGAVYAMMARGTGNARQARSELQGFLAALQEPFGTGQRALMSIGVNLGSGADIASGKLPAITDILKQIGGIYQKDPFLVRAALGPQLTHDLQSMFADIARTGSATTLDEKLNVAGDPAKLFRDQDQAASTLSAELSRLHTQFSKFGDARLTGPLRFISELLRENGDDIAALLGLLAGAFVAGKVIAGISALTTGFQALALAIAGVEIAAFPALLILGAIAAAAVLAYEAIKHVPEISEAPSINAAAGELGAQGPYASAFDLPPPDRAQKSSGEITIKIEDDSGRARLKKMKSSGLDLSVDMGLVMQP